MKHLTPENIAQLWDNQAQPCLSVYGPLQADQANRQSCGSGIAWRDIAREKLAATGVAAEVIQDLLASAEATLAKTSPAPEDQAIALFVSPSSALAFPLAQPVTEQVAVSDHFVLRDLLEQDLQEQDFETAWQEMQAALDSGRVKQKILTIVEAIGHGVIDLLIVTQGQKIPGRFDRGIHKLVWPKPEDPGALFEHHDLLEYVAIRTLRKGGRVYFAKPGLLPAEVDALALKKAY